MFRAASNFQPRTGTRRPPSGRFVTARSPRALSKTPLPNPIKGEMVELSRFLDARIDESELARETRRIQHTGVVFAVLPAGVEAVAAVTLTELGDETFIERAPDDCLLEGRFARQCAYDMESGRQDLFQHADTVGLP